MWFNKVTLIKMIMMRTMMLRTIYENKQKLRARGENTYERMMKKEKDQNLKKKERDLFLKNFMN